MNIMRRFFIGALIISLLPVSVLAAVPSELQRQAAELRRSVGAQGLALVENMQALVVRCESTEAQTAPAQLRVLLNAIIELERQGKLDNPRISEAERAIFNSCIYQMKIKVLRLLYPHIITSVKSELIAYLEELYGLYDCCKLELRGHDTILGKLNLKMNQALKKRTLTTEVLMQQEQDLEELVNRSSALLAQLEDHKHDCLAANSDVGLQAMVTRLILFVDHIAESVLQDKISYNYQNFRDNLDYLLVYAFEIYERGSRIRQEIIPAITYKKPDLFARHATIISGLAVATVAGLIALGVVDEAQRTKIIDGLKYCAALPFTWVRDSARGIASLFGYEPEVKSSIADSLREAQKKILGEQQPDGSMKDGLAPSIAKARDSAIELEKTLRASLPNDRLPRTADGKIDYEKAFNTMVKCDTAAFVRLRALVQDFTGEARGAFDLTAMDNQFLQRVREDLHTVEQRARTVNDPSQLYVVGALKAILGHHDPAQNPVAQDRVADPVRVVPPNQPAQNGWGARVRNMFNYVAMPQLWASDEEDVENAEFAENAEAVRDDNRPDPASQDQFAKDQFEQIEATLLQLENELPEENKSSCANFLQAAREILEQGKNYATAGDARSKKQQLVNANRRLQTELQKLNGWMDLRNFPGGEARNLVSALGGMVVNLGETLALMLGPVSTEVIDMVKTGVAGSFQFAGGVFDDAHGIISDFGTAVGQSADLVEEGTKKAINTVNLLKAGTLIAGGTVAGVWWYAKVYQHLRRHINYIMRGLRGVLNRCRHHESYFDMDDANRGLYIYWVEQLKVATAKTSGKDFLIISDLMDDLVVTDRGHTLSPSQMLDAIHIKWDRAD